MNGITFSSDLEFKYYKYLLDLQEKGIVESFTTQPKFELQEKFEKDGVKYRAIFYIADFEVLYKNGEKIVVDTKGVETVEFLIKKKLWNYVFRDKVLQVVNFSAMDGGWILLDDLKKLRKDRKKVKDKLKAVK